MGIGKPRNKNSQTDLNTIITQISNEGEFAREEGNLTEQLQVLKQENRQFSEQIQTLNEEVLPAIIKAIVELNQTMESAKQVALDIQEAIQLLNGIEVKATVPQDDWHKLSDLSKATIEEEKQLLTTHREEQIRLMQEHHSKLNKIVNRGEGIWLSNFWMKVFGWLLILYTILFAFVYFHFSNASPL